MTSAGDARIFKARAAAWIHPHQVGPRRWTNSETTMVQTTGTCQDQWFDIGEDPPETDADGADREAV
jgi:hypothetical protein